MLRPMSVDTGTRKHPMSNAQLVAKVWNCAHVRRDQGVSYGDCTKQIT